MATLATGISATDTLLIIAGDVSGVEKGLRFRLDDEICDLAGFDRHVTVAGKRAPGSDRSRWIVERHVGTSVPASHDAGMTVEAVVSASVSGDDLTLPIPFAGTGEGGAGAILTATVDLAAADIATLNSDPPQIIAAPGANKAIVPVAACLQTKAGVVPFTEGEQASVSLWCEGGIDLMLLGAPDFNQDLVSYGVPFTAGANPIANLPVLLHSGSDPGDPGGADGTGRITVVYHVMDLLA